MLGASRRGSRLSIEAAEVTRAERNAARGVYVTTLHQPVRLAGVFSGAATVALLAALGLHRWQGDTPTVLALLAMMALINTVVFLGWASKLPRCAPHASIIAAIVVIWVATVVTRGQFAFGFLYVWVGIYAGLAFPFRAATAYLVSSGFALALAEALTAHSLPVLAWIQVMGTAVVAAVVVNRLVVETNTLALSDPLTGLANRRAWDERLGEELARAQRSKMPLSIAVIDVDGLKQVNDHKGHEQGDLLLRSIATAWSACPHRPGDVLARIGGDEFAILLPGTSAEGMTVALARLRHVAPPSVSFSAGAVTWDGSEGQADLLARGDGAMYRDKALRRAASSWT